jgi:hypothetical protein
VALTNSVLGGGTVYYCTESDLQAALTGGGTVLFACSGTITISNTITISQDTVLDANGQTPGISGGNAVRLFTVMPDVRLRIIGLDLADGRVIGANGADGDPPSPGQDAMGAGILNQGGTVELINCTLNNHYVRGGNGGQDPANGQNPAKGGDAMGAAVFSLGGTLNATNCIFTNNAATGGLGTSFSPFPNYQGDGGWALGGAIYLENATAHLQTVSLTGNAVTGGAGQASPQAGTPISRGGDGAGGVAYLTNSTIIISGCSMRSNNATGGGVLGPFSYGSGPGSGNGLGGSLFVSQGSSATLQLSSFDGNSTVGGDGRRYQSSGVARGGALFNAGELIALDSTFSGHQSKGGQSSVLPGLGQGGAIYSIGSLAVSGCTLDDNSAEGGSASQETPVRWPGASGEGGALWSSGTLTATNSTFAANQAIGGIGGGNLPYGSGGTGSGGGIFVTGGTATLVNLTIAANRADGGPAPSNPPGSSEGGDFANTNGAVTFRNSIVANSANGGDLWGGVMDAGYNICSDGTANFSAVGSLNNADPQLSALSYNGGPTATMSLLVGSPARDAVPSGFPTTDQRGASRPQGPAADVGAFEADYIPSAPSIVDEPHGLTARAGTNVTFTVTASGTAPLYYQWIKNGNPISDATTTVLPLSNVQAADAAPYFVIVTNTSGSATSMVAVLTVDSRPIPDPSFSPNPYPSLSLPARVRTLVYLQMGRRSLINGGITAPR